MDAPIPPSALFSPSKARQHLLAQKDWDHVTSWLTIHYGPRIPSFERNDDTLKALLQLVAWNEEADEERRVVRKAEERVLEEVREVVGKEEERWGEVLERVEGGLTREGREGLEELGRVGVGLGVEEVDGVSLARGLVDLTQVEFAVSQQLQKAQVFEKSLQDELLRLKALSRELQGPEYKAPPDLPQQTTEWLRGTKQLKAKLAEYDDRLAAASQSPKAKLSILDVVRQKAEFDEARAKVERLEKQLEAFQDLPPDKALAKKKVAELEKELQALTIKRDQLFDELVG